MNWLLLTLGMLVLLFLFKNVKHHIIRKKIAFVFAMFVVLVILMFASSFFDIGSIFGKDSLIAKTGASVVETIGEKVDTPSLDSFTESFKSALNVSDSSVGESGEGGFLRIN